MTGSRSWFPLERSQAASTSDHEAEVSLFWERAKSTDRALKFELLKNPAATARAVKAIRKLPVIEARLGQEREAGMVLSALKRRCLCRIFTLAESGACILSIPAKGSDYSLGSHRQTLRRKVRAAEKAGVVCRPVTDDGEQLRLLEKLREALAVRRDPRYREANADHSVFHGTGLCTVAYGADGEPLVIAITPREGQWAVLGIFISFGETAAHSDARYLLTKATVERLSDEGVRYLVDTRSPSELSNGLRHFQRMVGFRIARVRLVDEKGTSPHGSRAGRLGWFGR